MLRSALLAAALAGSICSAATITIVPGAGLAGNSAALDAFNRAAVRWGSIFYDPVTVTINADLANLGAPNIIGSASSVSLQAGYTFIRNQMVVDAGDEADDAVVTTLPTAAQYSTTINSGFSPDGNIVGTKANLKALGFAGLDATFGTSDGTITFNSQFSFDYDNSDGVSVGTVDFETVAAHEIAHTLGFFSMVDTVDVNVSGSVGISTLDLFRFDQNTNVTAANFATATRSMVAGAEAVFSDGSSRFRMSTGVQKGDGRQASHWKDGSLLLSPPIGMMDPTLANQQIFPITYADIRALDVIGWDVVVPEPGSIGLLTAGLAGFGWLRLRARRRA